GRPVQFDTWLDDLQLYLLSDSKDSVTLYDLASGAATAPPAIANSSTHSQWLTRDTAARLAIRNHLPLAECTHFGQQRTAQALYDAIVARYSSPATAALGHLLLPYLFPELSAFATVEDLVSHLRASDARYCAAVPAEFLDRNPPPMDHFLSLNPTSLTVDLLEQHLLAAETSAAAVGAACGTPLPPLFEGCSPSPLAPSYASAAAADVSVPEDVGAASASAKRRSSKGKGGRGGGGGSGCGGGGSGSGGGGSSGDGGGGGTVGGSGGSGGGGGGSGGSGGSGGGGTGSGGIVARCVSSGGGQRQQQQRRSETPSPQQLREWFLRGASGGSYPYGIRTGDRAGQTCGRLHTQHRCFSRLDDAWRAEFGDDVELPRWANLLKPRIAIFDLDFDAYSGTLPGTAPAEALHTFTLDSGASRCFFRDSTTLTPLPAPVPARLADPSGGPVVARSSTVLPCPAVPSGSLLGLHLPSFSTNLVSTAALQDAMVTTTTPGGSSPYTLATEPSQVAASAQVSASGQVAASCSCRLLSHQTLQWNHRLGHPSLPRLRGMHSCLLVSGLPRSLPPLLLSPGPSCLPCVEGRQRAAPHSSSFPPTTAPLQTLHMDVWGRPTSVDRAANATFCWTFLSCVCTLTEVRRIGLVMEVACTSMIHAAAPHFLRPFVVQYATHQLNLWPRVSLPEVSPTLRWTGKVGDASVFRFYHPTSRRVLPSKDVTFDESVPFYRYAATGAGGAGAVGAGGAGVVARASDAGGFAATGPEGARTWGTGATGTGGVEGAGVVGRGARGAGAAGAGVAGTGARGTGAVVPCAGGAGGTVRPRPYFVPLLQQVLGTPSSTDLTPPLQCPPPDQSESPLQPASPLPAPSPYTEQSGGRTERREPASRPVSLVRTARCAPRLRPPPVPGMHAMALRPSSVPLRVPLPAPPKSSLSEVPDPESNRACAVCPTVSRLHATGVTYPSFESAAMSALVAELLEFVEDFECLAAAVPRFASMLLAPEGDPNAPDIPTPRSYAEAITGPYSSQWQAAMDAEMTSWKSTGTYVDEFPPPGANIVDGMWIFRGVDFFHTYSPTPKMTTLRVLLHVAAQRDYELHSLDFSTPFLQGSLHEEIWLRRPPGFTGTFPAGTQWSLRRPVYGLRQAPREWHDTLRTTLATLGFAPSTADPSLFLCTDTSPPPFYILVYVDDLVFATADTKARTLVKSELQKRHTCTDLGELHSYLGLQITRDRARRTITLTQSHMVHQVLQRFGFQFSSPQPTPLSTNHSLSAPPSDESVEPSGPYPELVGCPMYLMTCTRPDLAYPLSLLARYVAPGRHRKVHPDAANRVLRYLCSTSGMGLVLGGRGPLVLTGHADASWVDDSATQRSSQGYTFSLGSGSMSWRSTRSSSVLSSSCEAEIYTGSKAAQELRWLTYLLIDLGEQPRSPQVLYVDNKAMIALCQEHRMEHRMKHIALRYFLARELQQRGQLRLAYVATRANTADVFTKALPPGDHQRFATLLFCFS
ncbi:unnamed protein product, partial [Closterium sp. NIES-53]